MSVNYSYGIQNALNLGASSSTAAGAATDKDLGKEDFLKLLVTQMKYQDPLNPMEGIEFTSQLAEFTSLEQLYNVNSNLSGINAALTAQNNFQAINLVGKNVVAAGSTFSVSNGQSTGVKLTLPESAVVTMYIFDDEGDRVRTVECGAMDAGSHDLTWDAKNNYGAIVDDGEYQFILSAEDINGEQVETLTQIQGTVTGVSFADGDLPVVMINGIKVSINNIMQIDNVATPATDEE